MRERKQSPPRAPRPPHDDTGGATPRPWQRVLLFLALFAAALAVYRSPLGAPLERALIEQVTVPAAAALLQALDPAAGVQAVGARLAAPGGGLNVLNGCEGSDVVLLLIAGLLVAPVAWRWRLAGILVGVPMMFLINLGRVLVLFYAFRLTPDWFSMLHGLVAPLLLVAAACGGFVFWIQLGLRQNHSASTSLPR